MKRIARRLERARRYRNDGGFTLVEMLITVVIVGIGLSLISDASAELLGQGIGIER